MRILVLAVIAVLIPLSLSAARLNPDSALNWCVICQGAGIKEWYGPRREQLEQCSIMLRGTGLMRNAFEARNYEPIGCTPPGTLSAETRSDFIDYCRFHLPAREDRLGDYLVRFFAKARPCNK